MLFRSVRAFHSGVCRMNPFLYTTNAGELAAKIQTHILQKQDPVPQSTVVEALQAARHVQASVLAHDKFEQDVAHKKIRKQLEAVFFSDKVKVDAGLLKQAFLLKFPPATNIQLLSWYYERNPGAVVPKELALVPLRNSLFDGDLHSAIRITDLTTGHPNYIAQKNGALRKGVLQLAATALGITFFSKVGVQQIIEMGWLSASWRHLASLNAMVLTYLLNSSFFVTIVKFGRQLSSAGGDYLTWQKGTFYTHWYRHADEMAMCTRIIDTDVKLNGGVDSSAWLIEELCRKDDSLNNGSTLRPGLTRDGHKVRLLEPKDNIQDLKLQAYWMSGGDGFEWVEPDQDPAEILWRRHLHALHNPALRESEAKGLKWAEELIQPEKT